LNTAVVLEDKLVIWHEDSEKHGRTTSVYKWKQRRYLYFDVMVGLA
jgi:hypothetical protein